MRIFKIILYAFCIAVIARFTYYLAVDYQTFPGRAQMPFVLWTIDTIDLFIHEAGHLVFRMFGQVIYFMGGSIFQILIPIATVIVFGKSDFHSLLFTLYWTGQSAINVSIYIGDAPYQRLHLISNHVLHDWHWIFLRLDMMEDAETIASIVNVFGILLCIAGIGMGIYCLIQDIRYPAAEKPQTTDD
jgi:hypothetical protein